MGSDVVERALAEDREREEKNRRRYTGQFIRRDLDDERISALVDVKRQTEIQLSVWSGQSRSNIECAFRRLREEIDAAERKFARDESFYPSDAEEMSRRMAHLCHALAERNQLLDRFDGMINGLAERIAQVEKNRDARDR